MKDGKSLPRLYTLLESRNYEGKSALMLSIEHERTEITQYIMQEFPNVDLDKQDIKDGNCVMHIACVKEDALVV